jgi:ribosome-binding factor A
MSGFARAQRVGGLIQEILSDLLRRDISDPRLHLTTITHVKVTKDLRIARVYFATAGGAQTSAAAAQGFKSAAGFIKRCLGRQLGLRYMPQVEFFYDESFDYGAHIDQLLKSVKQENGTDRSEN